MSYFEIKDQDLLKVEALLPTGSPVYLLNLLKFKSQAEYRQHEIFEPCTGREAYFKRYLPVFLELAAPYQGIKPAFFGKVLMGLILEENESWDNVGLISYPEFRYFRELTQSETYKTIALPHRLAAIENYKLLVTVEADPLKNGL